MIIHTIFTLIILGDLIFLFTKIVGSGAAGIIEWVCWPLFGLAGFPLVIAVAIRIIEGIAIGTWLGHVF